MFLLSLNLYEVEYVRHRAPYFTERGSKTLRQQKGDAARTDIAWNRAENNNVREGRVQKTEPSAKRKNNRYKKQSYTLEFYISRRVFTLTNNEKEMVWEDLEISECVM